MFNRGIGRRPVFATRADYRRFLALLACMSREGLIEVHAFCLMSTHYHLLVRVPEGGDLSRAMMRIQNAYVRWFNRRNERDGPLFRGRFGSKPVETSVYWLVLLRYIDLNPVKAGICSKAASFEFSSSRYYTAGAGPRWLHRSHAAALMLSRHGFRDPVRGYLELVDRPLSDAELELVEARRQAGLGDDPSDILVGGTAAVVEAWMVRAAKNADGLAPSLPLASSEALHASLNRHVAQEPEAMLVARRKRVPRWPVLQAGLLHALCGWRCEQIADVQGCTNGTASRRVRHHRASVQADARYAELAARVGREALEITYAAAVRSPNGVQKNLEPEGGTPNGI